MILEAFEETEVAAAETILAVLAETESEEKPQYNHCIKTENFVRAGMDFVDIGYLGSESEHSMRMGSTMRAIFADFERTDYNYSSELDFAVRME